MAYHFCNSCGHRNRPESNFCSSCGALLDVASDHTVVLAKVDPLQDAPGADDDVVVHLEHLSGASLVVRSGPQAGEGFPLTGDTIRLGRQTTNEISLDDITVSRVHAVITRTDQGYRVRDAGSLNGTYVNQELVDEARLVHGDELRIGKFRLVFFEGNES